MIRKLLSGSIIAALMASTANADTLRDALVSAYQANPTLTAQREALKVFNERAMLVLEVVEQRAMLPPEHLDAEGHGSDR